MSQFVITGDPYTKPIVKDIVITEKPSLTINGDITL